MLGGSSERRGDARASRARLSDWLALRREALLHGREEALTEMEAWLDDERLRFVHVRGPAGVGKTALLLTLRSRLLSMGWDVRWIDEDGLAPSSHPTQRGDTTKTLFVFDGVERLVSFRAQLDELLAEAPQTSYVLLSSRGCLPEPYRADPAFVSALRVLTLGPLDKEASLRLLEELGVAREARAAIALRSGGHPLVLALEASRAGLTHAPSDTLEDVVDRLLASVHDERMRDALLVAVLLRRVDATTLERVVGHDGPTLSAKLHELVPLSSSDAGFELSSTLREALLDALRSRAPTRMTMLARRAQDAILEAIAQACPIEADALVRDLACACRFEPHASVFGLGSHVSFESGRASDAEVDAVRAAIERFEGRDAASSFDAWHDHPHARVIAIRSVTGGLRAAILSVDYAPGDPVLSREPFVVALDDAVRASETRAPVRRIRMLRFWLDLEHHQDTSAGPYGMPLSQQMQRELLLSGADIACAAHFDADHWLARPERPVHLLARARTPGGHHALFGVDLRVEAPVDTLRRFVEGCRTGRTETGADDTRTGRVQPDAHDPAQARATVREADIRRALRAMFRRNALVTSPLLELACVGAHAAQDTPSARASALRAIIEQIFGETLGERGHDGALASVLRATYLDAPRKGTVVAAELGMGYSTYRRWLAEGVQRVRTELEARERAHGDS